MLYFLFIFTHIKYIQEKKMGFQRVVGGVGLTRIQRNVRHAQVDLFVIVSLPTPPTHQLSTSVCRTIRTFLGVEAPEASR